MNHAWIESLEHRELFAGQVMTLGPAVSGPVAWPSKVVVSATTTPKSTAPTVGSSGGTGSTTAAARSTDFVGEWDGHVTVKIVLFRKKLDASIEITEQTPTTLRGTISIEGKDYSGTFTGKVNPRTGNFSWKVSDDGDSVKISGNLSRSGAFLTGDIRAEYAGFSGKGSFEFKKISD
jgi:hypothetical protein